MINLHVKPGIVESWDDFISKYPKFSIALDGFVHDKTKRDAFGPYANFDHHSFVDRIATRSTAEQVHMELNLGLLQTFRENGCPEINIYVNDCDEDTCLAIWLLRNHDRISHHADPLINKLVYCNDRLDTTSGSYPFGDIEMLRIISWIYEPYQILRAEKKLSLLKNENVMKSVIEDVCSRINLYTLGKAKEAELKNKLNVIRMESDFAVVEEEGPLSRMSLFDNGISAFLSDLGDNRYVIGRKSVWVKFDLEKIFKALNDKDKNAKGNNIWGGSDTIGGSPRANGSDLSLDEIVTIIKNNSK